MSWNYKKAKVGSFPEQKKSVDPRSKTSFRGKTYLATGDKVAPTGQYTRKKQKPVTWY